MEETKTKRIVLLGKTGVGKSSLANTIFGEADFKINHTPNSETGKCQAETRSVNGRSVMLIDTPGFFDTDRPEEKLKPEMLKCIIECAPGPHAFLIVLEIGKFTDQEKDVIRKICEYFSEDAFKYAAVVFTHGDQLPEKMKIEQFVQMNEGLRDLVKKCGGRCHVIDNRYWKNNQQDEYRSNQFQVAELLNTIDDMVKKNKGYYTNKMLQTVDTLNKKYGKIYVSDFLNKCAGITTGALLGALLGVPAMIILVVKALMTMKPAAAAAAVVVEATTRTAATGLGIAAGGVAAEGAVVVEATMGAAAGGAAATGLGIAAGGVAAAGAVVGGYIGYCEAVKADSVGEAAKNTAKSVCNKALQGLKEIQINEKQQQSEEKGPLLKHK